MIKVLAAIIGNMVNLDVATPKYEYQQSINRASTECQQSVNRASTEHQQSVNKASAERQQSIKDFGCCMLYNPRAVLWHLPISEVLAASMGNMVSVNVATPKNERQQSVNDFGCCILYNARAVQCHFFIIEVLDASISNMACINIATPKNVRQQIVNKLSTKRQQSVNNFRYCILYNPRAVLRHLSILDVLATISISNGCGPSR
jgi:hypothetical protein